MRDAIVSADAAQNLVVIRTVPGMAMGVAAALDAMKWPEILGSIAGDDTIMCALRNSDEAETVTERVLALVQ